MKSRSQRSEVRSEFFRDVSCYFVDRYRNKSETIHELTRNTTNDIYF
jgi:hypothetical protein